MGSRRDEITRWKSDENESGGLFYLSLASFERNKGASSPVYNFCKYADTKEGRILVNKHGIILIMKEK